MMFAYNFHLIFIFIGKPLSSFGRLKNRVVKGSCFFVMFVLTSDHHTFEDFSRSDMPWVHLSWHSIMPLLRAAYQVILLTHGKKFTTLKLLRLCQKVQIGSRQMRLPSNYLKLFVIEGIWVKFWFEYHSIFESKYISIWIPIFNQILISFDYLIENFRAEMA